MEKDFSNTYMKVTQLFNMYLNIKEMTNNWKINDLPTKESP